MVVTANGDLWLLDVARATFSRLTSNETAGNGFAVWTPDGRVIFRTLTGMQWIDASGSGRSGAIPGTSVNDYPNSVSPDGGTLAFIRIAADTSGDVYALSLKGEPQPCAIVQQPPTKAAHSSLLMAAGWRMPRTSPERSRCTCVHSPVPVGG